MENVAMNPAFNLAPLWRSGIGFDGVIDMLNEAMQPVATHPPYNIEKTGEDAYRITFVVAGFQPNEMSIPSEPNLLDRRRPARRSTEWTVPLSGAVARSIRAPVPARRLCQ